MSVERIDMGNTVICDGCNVDYTDRDDTGGILFQSKALCPPCAIDWELRARRYDETHFIRARCPEGLAFRVWVLDLRGGNNTMTISTGADAFRAMRQRGKR